MRATPIKMEPTLVHKVFSNGTNGLHRRLADGGFKRITGLNSGRLMTMYNGERIYGIDIAWCLHHGNWPKYPLASLDGNPFNLAIDNIYPARLGAVRFVCTKAPNGLYYHPLDRDHGFSTPEKCKTAWMFDARTYYEGDLDYVIAEEARERALRAASGIVLPGVPKRRTPQRIPRSDSPGKMPSRPKAIPGRVWHYHAKEWLSLPEPCHVADDYRMRALGMLAGAVRFEYSHEYEEVFGYDAEGKIVPKPYVALPRTGAVGLL